MRFVIIGAGAIGGSLGALLHLAGYPVQLVARGAHLAKLRADGLRLRRPTGDLTLRIEASARPRVGPGDTVLLCVKSQDTEAAIDGLPPSPIVCVQNGVDNEPRLLRRGFAPLGAMAWILAVHLVPGEVALHCGEVAGVLDLGAWPEGVGEAAPIAAALRAAGFDAEVRPDIARWKHAKLLAGLPGALQALGQDAPDLGPAAAPALVAEGEAVLRAAGIVFAAPADLMARGAHIAAPPINGAPRPGGSLWQSRRRGTASEIEHLNGFIVRLARQHGVEAPLNAQVVEAYERAAHPR